MVWGIYRGIEKVEVDRVVRDYIKIEYQGGSNLYILATQLDSLQKYSGADAANTPKLNKLGTSGMEQDQKQSPGCCKKYRKGTGRVICSPSGEGRAMYVDRILYGREEFEEMFPYEETEDQLSCH